jgi:hypothetical protein
MMVGAFSVARLVSLRHDSDDHGFDTAAIMFILSMFAIGPIFNKAVQNVNDKDTCLFPIVL